MVEHCPICNKEVDLSDRLKYVKRIIKNEDFFYHVNCCKTRFGKVPKPTAEELASFFHEVYEPSAKKHSWKTQESCRVPFNELEPENRLTMLETCEKVIAHYFS